MAVVRILMVVIGLLAVAFGLLFTLQGLGIVHWPRSSFMLDDRSWAMAWRHHGRGRGADGLVRPQAPLRLGSGAKRQE